MTAFTKLIGAALIIHLVYAWWSSTYSSPFWLFMTALWAALVGVMVCLSLLERV